MLLGTDNNKLTDKDIAQDMIKDSKFCATSLSAAAAAAAAEAVNPQLRQMLA